MNVKSVIVGQRLQPAPALSWVEYLPSNIRPFCYLARLHRGPGLLLSFYPSMWSTTMACYALDAPMTTIWTSVGFFFAASIAFRSAGCVINDMWDRDFDALVSRTRTRPLATGEISMFQAFAFLIPHLALIVWLLSQLNEYSFRLGLSSVVLVVLYPVMKRVTDWPQAALGLCINWGALIGAASVAGSVDWKVYTPLYLGAVCWTMVYETVYSRQDRDEDIKYGMRSATIIFGENIRPILAIFTFICWSLVSYAGICNGHGYPFFIGVAVGAAHLARFLAKVDFESQASCDTSFRSCSWFGFWVLAGAMADCIVKTQF